MKFSLLNYKNEKIEIETSDANKTNDLNHQSYTPDEAGFIEYISNTLPKTTKDSLIVECAEVDMYGVTIANNVTPIEIPKRRTLQLDVYTRATAAAANAVIREDASGDLLVTLLHNKLKDTRSDDDALKKAGVPNFWDLPAGFAQPKPHSQASGISAFSPDLMDEAERLVAFKKISPNNAYKRIADEHKFVPGAILPMNYDLTTEDAGRRETKEETGENVTNAEMHFLRMREEVSKNSKMLTIVRESLIKPGNEEADLPLSESNEIGVIVRAKIRDFKFIQDQSKPGKIKVVVPYIHAETEHLIEVPMTNALLIGRAIRRYRNQEIKNLSQVNGLPLFNNPENVLARIAHQQSTGESLQDKLGLTPMDHLLKQKVDLDSLPGNKLKEKQKNLRVLSSLGEYADDYHKHNILPNVKLFIDQPIQSMKQSQKKPEAVAKQENLMGEQKVSGISMFNDLNARPSVDNPQAQPSMNTKC